MSESDQSILTESPSNQNGPTQGISRTISTEEIREYFECPICLLVPRPGTPIFACSQGQWCTESQSYF